MIKCLHVDECRKKKKNFLPENLFGGISQKNRSSIDGQQSRYALQSDSGGQTIA